MTTNLEGQSKKIDKKISKLEKELADVIREMQMNADKLDALQDEMRRHTQLLSSFYKT